MKRGVLLMNTGSPDSAEEEDVRRFLGEFLMDPHVIDLPWPLRALLVRGIILPRRPARSAEAYKKIWTEKGSPLIRYSTEIKTQLGEGVELGMASGNPSAREGIEKLLGAGAEEIVVLPMFPQSAMATTDACVAKVKAELKHCNSNVPISVIPPFHAHPAYVKGLADSLAGIEDHILFSYHGLPLRHLKKQSPPDYQVQCLETTRLVVAKADIPEDRYSISFQSRMGRAKWIAPYTEDMLRNLPAIGKRRLAVICPSFVCDCLETIEEIGIRGRDVFTESGGESFRLIPCLNSGSATVQLLSDLVSSRLDSPV
ncbi:MAG: ferrochelatase [Kiritimatiellales bacterium]|nr:ferrochelatase [Kiritimatiellales bacterium]